jgi:hypothetical protein
MYLLSIPETRRIVVDRIVLEECCVAVDEAEDVEIEGEVKVTSAKENDSGA